MGNACAPAIEAETKELVVDVESTESTASPASKNTDQTDSPKIVTGLPPGDWDGKPLFEHVQEAITEEEKKKILENVVLSEDPSSKHFAKREKAIRFCTIINGRVQTFTQNYFLQDVEYNDFSGGYRRYYALINEELFDTEAPIAKVVLDFAKYYGIPEKTAILVQIQTTFFKTIEDTKTRKSVTGQGAENVFHGSLDGTEQLCDEMELGSREGVYFKDNSLFHTVTRGAAVGKYKHMDEITRTVMIMHAPGEIYMQGLPNPNNDLGANESSVKLRDNSVVVQQREKRMTTMIN